MNVASPFWYPFENGATRGMRGIEGGIILEDEQHDEGARITWEDGCLRAACAISVVVYGWAGHTRFFDDEATAKQAYDDMKIALHGVLVLLPKHVDDLIVVEKIDAAIADFLMRFP